MANVVARVEPPPSARLCGEPLSRRLVAKVHARPRLAIGASRAGAPRPSGRCCHPLRRRSQRLEQTEGAAVGASRAVSRASRVGPTRRRAPRARFGGQHEAALRARRGVGRGADMRAAQCAADELGERARTRARPLNMRRRARVIVRGRVEATLSVRLGRAASGRCGLAIGHALILHDNGARGRARGSGGGGGRRCPRGARRRARETRATRKARARRVASSSLACSAADSETTGSRHTRGPRAVPRAHRRGTSTAQKRGRVALAARGRRLVGVVVGWAAGSGGACSHCRVSS